MTLSVYLAGPITGCSFQGATSWRGWARAQLEAYDIKGISPLRSKVWLEDFEEIGDAYEEFPLSSAKGISMRDFFDVDRASLILANLLGAERVSIGTVMEITRAATRQKPVVIAMEESGLHDHAMIRELGGVLVVRTLEEAIVTAIQTLSYGDI